MLRLGEETLRLMGTLFDGVHEVSQLIEIRNSVIFFQGVFIKEDVNIRPHHLDHLPYGSANRDPAPLNIPLMRLSNTSFSLATVILVAVAIIIAIAVAFWASGPVGVFTRYEKIELTSVYAEPTGTTNQYYVGITAKNQGQVQQQSTNSY